MSETLSIMFDENGIAKEYDDMFDITIHCESEEEQNEVLKILNRQWITVSERLPEDGEDVLVWYEYFRYGEYNCMYQTYGIACQYGGRWGGSVCGKNARCIAWQPLPEPYKAESEDKK